MKMKEIPASDRFFVGQSVEWVSKSGNHYAGTIEKIRENRLDPLTTILVGEFTVKNPNPKGALVTVALDDGGYRNFYENEVEAFAVEGV